MSCTEQSTNKREATVVGAGLGGLMMAIRLARRGYAVTVYDRRANVAQLSQSQRSFTVTISKRGLQALTEIDLADEATETIKGVSHQALADHLGTYRETVSAILRDFKRQGLVELGYRRITLVDSETLRDIAGIWD